MTITKDEARALLDDYVMATQNGWVPSVECALREASPNLARAFISSEEAREKLEERVRVLENSRADAMLRRHMNAPEDPHVEALCARYGYGAVMDAASRLWARRDSMGAFYIGGCIGMKSDDEARAALTGSQP